MNKSRRLLIITGWVGATMVGVSLCLCLSIYLFLRSTPGSNFLLGQIETQLKQYPSITFQYKTGLVDPFSRIEFEGLNITIKQPQKMELQLSADKIQVVYQIKHFWPLEIEVIDLHAVTPQISGEVWVDESLDEGSLDEGSNRELSTNQIDIGLTIRSGQISDLGLKVLIHHQKQQMQVDLQSFDGEFAAQWIDHHFIVKTLKVSSFATVGIDKMRPLNFSIQANKKGEDIKADVKMVATVTGEDLHPVSVEVNASFLAFQDLSKISGQMQVFINKNQLMSFDGKIVLAQKKAQVTGKLHVTTGLALKKLLPKIPEVGEIKLETSILAHVESSVHLKELSDNWKHAKYELQLESKVIQEGKEPSKFLMDSLSLTQNLSLNGDRLSLVGNLKIPSIEIPNQLKVQGLDLEFKVHSDSIQRKDLSVQTQIVAKKMVLGSSLRKTMPLPKLLKGVKIVAEVNVLGGTQWFLKRLEGSIEKTMVRLEVNGSGSMDGKNFQSEGVLSLQIPKTFPKIVGHKLYGGVYVPWSLSLENGRHLDILGKIVFRDFSWNKNDIAIEHMVGAIPFEESLTIKGNEVLYANLLVRNPFARVDYDRVQPFMANVEPFRIKTIRFEEKSYGPFVGYFSLRQNLLSGHSFDLDLGGGTVNGEFYLDTYPRQMQMGFLVRLADVQLSRVLPRRFKIRGSQEKRLSVRTALEINLRNNLVNGRIDITEIGADQFISLINVLDPKYEDPQFNKMRMALAVANPTRVELKLEHGYMDIYLKLTGWVSMGLDVLSIPVSTLLTSAISDLKMKIKEGVKNE